MGVIGIALIVIAFIISLIYGIQLLIMAFQTSILWGLGYLLVPFVGLIFIFMHWDRTKGPFLKCLIAIPIYIVGFMLMPSSSV